MGYNQAYAFGQKQLAGNFRIMPKTITDIIPPSRRRAMEETGAVPGYTPPPAPPSYDMDVPPPPSAPMPPGMPEMRRSRGGFPWRIALVAVAVVVIAVGVIYAFSGASVEVTPALSPVSVSGDFSATPSSGDLPYEVVTVDKVGSKAVTAEGTETANDPASGSITVYNAQAEGAAAHSEHPLLDPRRPHLPHPCAGVGPGRNRRRSGHAHRHGLRRSGRRQL